MAEILDNKQLTEKLGAISEFLNEKIDIDANNSSSATPVGLNANGTRTVVEVSDKSLMPSWYRVYSDGWCEQGGQLSSVSQDTTTTVSLPKTFADTNYNVLITATGGARNSTQFTNGNSVSSKAVSSFVMRTDDYTFGRMWRASGYIS